MSSNRRLIEVAFPLKQTSIDSVHEKNVRHGHISTLHIWPARRPLAACRAALVATLLPDPENDEERQIILEKLGGKLVQRAKKVKNADGKVEEKVVEETEGGILHWGREASPDLDWFRQKIREAYGGRVPKVLDPFAGGGAIPLEAMRLGCEVTAVDINPVAWFILKCTLEYPQKLAGQMRPLPDFALQDPEFMEAYFKAQGLSGQALKTRLADAGHISAEKQPQLGFNFLAEPTAQYGAVLEADLAWHVRAWGRWVLAQARRDLARFYPTYADFEPLVDVAHKVETRPMQLVPLKEDSTPDLDAINAEFDEAYLRVRANPRWVAKPTVAYLWARTVICKNCRATIPLLKTRWLVKKDKKRVALTMQPNADKTGVIFGVQSNIPVKGGTSAQRRENDKQIGSGTMSRSGATCPCCGMILATEDIRLEGQANRLGLAMTAVVVDGENGKEFRLPTKDEVLLSTEAASLLEATFNQIPFGLPLESVPQGGSRKGGGSPFTVHIYGLTTWKELFSSRQLLTIATFIQWTRRARTVLVDLNYDEKWCQSIQSELAIAIDKLADRESVLCRWDMGYSKINSTFTRFALPLLWDYAEGNPLSNTTGNYLSCVEWVAEVIEHASQAGKGSPKPTVINESAISYLGMGKYDLILTDPPYYDAIPYSDLMDFFYIWLRRTTFNQSQELSQSFSGELSPKWDSEENNGELIDDASRFSGDQEKSKQVYEDGMARTFQMNYGVLSDDGRLVIVFAHKQPDAWETLVTAIIRAGFVVDGSWPIQTEMGNRSRAHGSAALASSVWLVCKKRPETARPGWDNRVLDEMRQKIADRLRDFWDAGIRGPDFVWAATGPALEAYSQYPAVKKANEPGQLMTVSEFLRHVRRMVVDFVVGRVLTKDGETSTVSGLDDVTTYYLLHRNDFGFDDAPAGACILYAVSCGLSDKDLADRYDLLARTGGKEAADEEEAEDIGASEIEEGSGSTLRLKSWQQRKRPSMGFDPALDNTTAHLPMFPDMEAQVSRSREVPLIDQIHRLMHLWKAGDVNKVNDYLDIRGLRHNQLFHQLLQALIELAPAGSEERALMESISNHVVGRGQAAMRLFQD